MVSEQYLEDLQELFVQYRQGRLTREELELARKALESRYQANGRSSAALVEGQSRLERVFFHGSLVFLAAVLSLFLVGTLGFMRF